jgi:hypothetical protein
MADNTKNPRNNQSELFRRLTRLFSGPIINYRSQSGRRIKRQHLDKHGTTFKSASGQQFKKSTYNPLDRISHDAIANQRRAERYVDFDQMEYMPELASALDIYADEMTTASDLSPMIKINCANEEIKSVLVTLYTNILNLDANLFGWCRTMCKYGDFFLYLDIDESFGIRTVLPMPPQEVERLEGQDTTNPNYVQFQWNSAGMTFENWQISHFRILGHDKYAPYGTSILEPARRIWRQLTLIEDAMMAYRVIRSPERRVFYIDVGQINPADVEQYMQKIITQMKRHQVLDDKSGRVDLRYNPMSVEEDYYIPVRGQQSNTRIENLAGGQHTTAIDDVKYLRDKLFSALKIPQSYLTMGDGAEEDKTTLAQKDIRFARTIQRLQRVIISELEKIGIVHLYTLGFRGDDLLSFKLSLNNPSRIAELQELEHWRTKFEVAGGATEGYFSRRWVAQHLFSMSEEEFLRNQREIYYDRKYDASLQAVAETAAAEAAGMGGMAPPPGGDPAMGGEEGLPPDGEAPPPETEMPPDAGAEPPPEPDTGDLLAAPPGSRPSPRMHKGPNSHSAKRYDPVRSDKRDMGARKRSFNSVGRPEFATYRSTNLGASELSSLAKGNVFTEQRSNYNDTDMIQESRLFEINYEVRTLIDNLQKSSEQVKDEDEA